MHTLSPAPRHAGARRGWPLLLVLALGTGGPALAQTLDPQLNPVINGSVRSVGLQGDGNIIIGGDFTQVSGQSRPHLARLTGSGVVAAAPAMPDARVEAIAVQADGRIVIGGDFSSVGGGAHRYVARLLGNGQIDPGFQSGVGHSAGVRVTPLGVHGDGKVVIAGGFDTVSGQPRPGLARLTADGSNDSSFNPPALESYIDALLLQADGKVVLAGPLGKFEADCEYYCVLRLDSNGSVDAGFGIVPVLGSVRHLAQQADGRILVGGGFSALGDHDSYFVGRLEAHGGPDTGFSNTALRYSDIMRVVPLPDGHSLIAGEIRWGTGGQTVDRIARLLPGGGRDTGFVEPDFDNMILGSALQPDMQLLVAGLFTQVAGQSRLHLARLRVGERADLIYGNGFD